MVEKELSKLLAEYQNLLVKWGFDSRQVANFRANHAADPEFIALAEQADHLFVKAYKAGLNEQSSRGGHGR